MASKTTGKKSVKSTSARPASKSPGPRKSAASAQSNSPTRSPSRSSGRSHAPVKGADKKRPKGLTIKSPTPLRHPKATVNTQSQAQPDGAAGKSQQALDRAKNLSIGRGKRTRTVAEAASTVSADSKGYVFINGRRVRMISIKAGAMLKKPRTNGAPLSAGTASPASDSVPVGSIKTKLSRKELNHYRDLLLLKRRELVGDLHAMENEALRSGGGNLSHMPIHMADIGTDTYDQDFMLGLAAAERDQLREIDAALQRIEDRTYGVCQLTGKPIPKARLDAKPWAKYTIEAARQMEGQWGR